jgi:hypothetical protein
MKLAKFNGIAYWMDNNYNYWNSRLYTESEAWNISKTLVNCFYCFDCKECTNCIRCKECCDCNNLQDSSFCLNCNDSKMLLSCKRVNSSFGLALKEDVSNIIGGDYCQTKKGN